jgi:hypothetical protein
VAEFAIVMLLSGAWVFTLTVVADSLVGIPFGLLAGKGSEFEAWRSRVLTRPLLIRRMIVAPAVLLVPTAGLSWALLHFAVVALDIGALRFLWVLTGATVIAILVTTANRLLRTEP